MLVTWLYEKIEPRMFSSPIRGEPLARPDWLKPALSLNDLSDFILGAMLFIPFLSLTVRRLHDRNMTGWWGVSLVVVYLNANNWFFLKLSPYLSLPDHQLFRGVVVFFSVCTYALLISLSKTGTRGPNRFGADPMPAKIDVNVFS